MSRFTIPRDLYYGRGSLETLKTIKGRRATVVSDEGAMRKFGFLEQTVAYLKEAGLEVDVIEGVEPDPSVETVMKGAEQMRKFNPDWIVALGGGSPIDAAKAMWTFYEYPDTSFESLISPFNFPELRQKAKFIAISSTSGTATEVTAFSVITDYSKGIKYPLADYNITPDIAIVDPDIADTMPKSLAAYTGMDAISHAFEAYVSTAHSPITDPIAIGAIRTIFSVLSDAYNGNSDAKEQMHYSQCLAGFAFSNALLGIVHSMAHKTGAVFSTGHIPHGCANAMYLPFVIAYNAKEESAKARYVTVAKDVGIVGESDDDLVQKLIDKVNALRADLNLPKTLKEFGIQEDEFKEKISTISANAIEDVCTASNPRAINQEQMEKLFNCIYYGQEVDF